MEAIIIISKVIVNKCCHNAILIFNLIFTDLIIIILIQYYIYLLFFIISTKLQITIVLININLNDLMFH